MHFGDACCFSAVNTVVIMTVHFGDALRFSSTYHPTFASQSVSVHLDANKPGCCDLFQLAFESLALTANALTLLETGDLAVCR